ncbi:MAG: nicotinate (nicotinamide) nucleotide adenylyltransferase [Planctomycetota bacterium]|jgi:nicotinate-nucleotide adenylyltransferase
MAGTCLFGGAFDPPHRSHRRIASQVVELCQLDRLLILPCGDHPIKPAAVASPEQRLRMCQLNFAGLDRVQVSDFEVHRPGKSYSVDTLREFRGRMLEEQRLFFLIGSDNIAGLVRWHEYERLFDLAEFLVFPRAGYPCNEESLASTALTAGHREHLLRGLLSMEEDAVNATDIRAQLAAGVDSADLEGPVLDYIRMAGLYGR